MPSALHRSRDYLLARWMLRSCAIAAVLGVVTPPIAIGLTGWWLLQTLGPQAAAAAQYRSARACSTGASPVSCYSIEPGLLASLWRIPGRCGYTDELSIRLADGLHDTRVTAGCLDPFASYTDTAGQLKVKRYRGQITAILAANGRVYETDDSPAVGASLAKGLFPVAVALLGPWMVISLIFLVRHPRAINDIWTLLRKGQLREPQSTAA